MPVVKSRLLLPLLAIALTLLFAALGRWQLQRASDKEAMLAASKFQVAERRREPLPTALAKATGYSWIGARGRFEPTPVLLLDNQRRGAKVGVLVLGIFLPEDSSGALLVNLGWLPLPADRTLPTPRLPADPVWLEGLLAPPPAAGIAMGPAYQPVEPDRWLLTRVDVGALAVALKRPLAARVLRLDPSLPLGYPRDLDVLANTLPPERHRGYALQWFGLALATVLFSLFLRFRRSP